MKFLIAEDDFTSRLLLQRMLAAYGNCDVVINGKEAVESFDLAHQGGEPYDLICLDIMMPEMDGKQALKAMREIEKKHGIRQNQEVKIIMTTALDSPRHVFEAYYQGGCTSYLVKPIVRAKLFTQLSELGLIGTQIKEQNI